VNQQLKSHPPNTVIKYIKENNIIDCIYDFEIKYIDEYSLLVLIKRFIFCGNIYFINVQDPKKSIIFPIKESFNIRDSCIFNSESIHALCLITDSQLFFYNFKTKVLNHEELNNNQSPLKIKSDDISNRLFVFYQNMIKVFQIYIESNEGRIKVNFIKTFDTMGDYKNIIKSNFNYPYGLFIYEKPILRIAEFTSNEEDNNIMITDFQKICDILNYSSFDKIKSINIEKNKTILAIFYLSNIFLFLLEKIDNENRLSIIKVIEKAHETFISKHKKIKYDNKFYLVTYDNNQIIKFWNLKTFKNVYTINSNSKIKNFYFSEKNKSLIVIDEDSLIKIWQLENELK
jgi:WD40 repeat protein